MANHRDLAKLNGMQEQLKAHLEIGASKMTGKKEDKKGKKYSSSKAKAGVTSASKSTTKGKKEQDAGVAATEVTGESEKPQKSAKVKLTKLTKSKVKTRFETRVGKKSLEQMKEMLKELEERPGDVMLSYRSLQEIIAPWRRKAIPVTGTGKSQKSCGKLAKYINFIVPKVYKVPCGIGPLNLLGELLPKRKLTHEKSLRRLPEPKTPLDLQAELTMLASLLEHYPKELLLWQLLAAALLDENMTPRVVFNAFMPRFSAWNHQFFGLHKGMADTASTFRTLRAISCILILIMAYLLDSKVAELLDLMAQRGFHESLDGEYGDCRDLWPKQVKTKLQDLLTGIPELQYHCVREPSNSLEISLKNMTASLEKGKVKDFESERNFTRSGYEYAKVRNAVELSELAAIIDWFLISFTVYLNCVVLYFTYTSSTRTSRGRKFPPYKENINL